MPCLRSIAARRAGDTRGPSGGGYSQGQPAGSAMARTMSSIPAGVEVMSMRAVSDSTRKVCGVPPGAYATAPTPQRRPWVATQVARTAAPGASSGATEPGPVGGLAFDEPDGYLAFEQVERFVLRVGVQRWCGAEREHDLPHAEPSGGLLAGELRPHDRAEEPQHLAAWVGDGRLRDAVRCRDEGGLADRPILCDQAALARLRGRLLPVGDAELGEDRRDVVRDGALREA